MMARRSSGRALSTASIWPWDTMTCCWRPTPESDSSSWMSSSRQGTPLMAYSLSPERKSVRLIVTSVKSIGRMPSPLSRVRATSARPSAGRFEVPAKITSSIDLDRTTLGACAPSTQPMASTTFDLPEPFGPTTTVMPGVRSRRVASANDLNPLRVSDFRNNEPNPSDRRRRGRRRRYCGAGPAPRMGRSHPGRTATRSVATRRNSQSSLRPGTARSRSGCAWRSSSSGSGPGSGGRARRPGRRPHGAPGTSRARRTRRRTHRRPGSTRRT